MVCFILVLVAALAGSVSWAQNSKDTLVPAPGASGAGLRMYQAQGVVISVESGRKQVTIKHDAVPGYMQAMTMPFEVKDTNELAGLLPGASVSFRIVVTDKEGWIDSIHRLSVSPAQDARGLVLGQNSGGPANGATRLSREVEELKTGDPLPEYHFTNQLSQRFSTSQFKGKVLAINFLFTRCPFPNFCPRMANDFSEVQKKMLAKKGSAKDWHLLTISFDPAFDTPEVLKSYSQLYGCKPEDWTFATGSLDDITAIGEQFGLAFWHDETGSISHNLRTVVLDASGRVRKIYPGNQWTSDELVEEMLKVETPVK